MRIRAILAILGIVIFQLNQSPLNAQTQDTCTGPVFVFVEHGATFMGGDLNNFRDWVQQNLAYLAEDIERDVSGSVVIQFVINTEGYVIAPAILRGTTSTMNEEAVRVVRSSPRWNPANQGGRPVCQQFTIPVVFNLSE